MEIHKKKSRVHTMEHICLLLGENDLIFNSISKSVAEYLESELKVKVTQ